MWVYGGETVCEGLRVRFTIMDDHMTNWGEGLRRGLVIVGVDWFDWGFKSVLSGFKGPLERGTLMVMTPVCCIFMDTLFMYTKTSIESCYDQIESTHHIEFPIAQQCPSFCVRGNTRRK